MRKAKAVFTNHPFTEGEKKEPIYVTKNDIGQFIYPDFGLDYSDLNAVYVSTDKITVCTMDIGPGGFFDPPDYHPGDEAYYVLNGVITQFNPLTGQAIRVKAGESLLIPKGALHSAYNFEQEPVRVIAVIAPKIVEDQLFPTDIPKVKNTFKAEKSELFEQCGELSGIKSHGSIADLGRWPLDGKELRDKKVIFHITEDRKLFIINGEKQPCLMKFSVSNDFMHTGEYVLPAGGTTCRHTDEISHPGQTVLFGLEGPATVYLTDSRETYVLEREEALYIPENTKYQLVNYGENAAKVFFAIAPEY